MTMLMDVFSGIGHFKLKLNYSLSFTVINAVMIMKKIQLIRPTYKGIQMVENWISGTRIPVMMMKIFAVIVT